MEELSLSKIIPADIGLTDSIADLTDYIKYGIKEGTCKFISGGNMLFLTDESGSRLMGVIDGEEKEYYLTYNASTKLEAVVTEYLPNLYEKEYGAIVVEDHEGSLYNLGAEIDFYSVLDKIELPSAAVMKIYAMAIDLNIFRDIEEFDNVVNKNPIATSNEGKQIGIGPVFMTPTGIMPGNEETAFPAMAYIHAKVKKIDAKIHSFTKNEFFVLTCEGVMCDFELLCSPGFMNENVKEGSVVTGYVLFRVEILETEKLEHETIKQTEN